MVTKTFTNQLETIKIITHPETQWINVEKRGDAEIAWLQQNFKFHPLDIEDVAREKTRPKFDEHDHYFFMVLSFPTYNHTTRTVHAEEVDFFISKEFIITIHNNSLHSLQELFKLCLIHDEARNRFLDKGPGNTLYMILSKIMYSTSPIIDALTTDVDGVEKKLFISSEKDVLHEILVIKQNISEVRFIVQAHKTTIRKMIAHDSKFFKNSQLNVYFSDLVEEIKELWDNMENLREAIATMHETNEALMSHKLNQTMKFLTLLSVLMLPASVITGLFGMNVFEFPFGDTHVEFWNAFGVIAIVEFVFLIFFKWKKLI